MWNHLEKALTLDDNFSKDEAFKAAMNEAVPGGPAIAVKDKDGKIMGFCGRTEPVGIDIPKTDYGKYYEKIRRC